MLEDFTAKFENVPLYEYGWDSFDVRDALADNIPDKSICKYAQSLAFEESLHKKIDDAVLELKWLDGRTDGFTQDEIGDISSAKMFPIFCISIDRYLLIDAVIIA